ncbi:unnamed protein product [Caenorhabditis nigoni]
MSNAEIFYTKQRVVHFEGFARNVENDVRFSELPIGKLAKTENWFISFRKTVENNETSYAPCIYNRYGSEDVVHQIDVLFKLKNRNKEIEDKFLIKYSLELKNNYCAMGRSISVLDLMNSKSGWLDENGTISVEYGIRVKALKEYNQIWRFNFYDKISKNEIIHMEPNMSLGRFFIPRFYGHKEILNFHTNYFDGISDDSVFQLPRCDPVSAPDICFQIAHGVQMKDFYLTHVINAADLFKLWNVARYCELKIIEALELESVGNQTIEDLGIFGYDFAFQTAASFYVYCSKFRMRRLAGVVLRNMNSEKEMRDFMKEISGYASLLSGEAIKMLVRKIFDFYT